MLSDRITGSFARARMLSLMLLAIMSTASVCAWEPSTFTLYAGEPFEAVVDFECAHGAGEPGDIGLLRLGLITEKGTRLYSPIFYFVARPVEGADRQASLRLVSARVIYPHTLGESIEASGSVAVIAQPADPDREASGPPPPAFANGTRVQVTLAESLVFMIDSEGMDVLMDDTMGIALISTFIDIEREKDITPRNPPRLLADRVVQHCTETGSSIETLYLQVRPGLNPQDAEAVMSELGHDWSTVFPDGVDGDLIEHLQRIGNLSHGYLLAVLANAETQMAEATEE